jgi:hypothetical protein
LEVEEKINEGINEVNKLIDLMTLDEANNLNEQLKELEQIELEKGKINKSTAGSSLSGAIAAALNPTTLTARQAPATSSSFLEQQQQQMSSGEFNLTSFSDILSQATNEFEREWESAVTKQTDDPLILSPSHTTDAGDEFNFFSKNNNSSALFSAEFKDLIGQKQQQQQQQPQINLDLDLLQQNDNTSTSKTPMLESANTANKKNLAWFDLFAELDPIKNPDTIGKESVEDERNC